MKKLKNFLLYALSPFLFLFFLDQITKYLIVKNRYHLPVNIIGNYLRFVYGENRHAIFGISFGPGFMYFILPGIALCLVLYLMYKYRDKPSLLIPLSFIMAGGVSNLLDRAIRGFVVDFIDMGIGRYRWYTYNFADAFTLLSIIYLIFYDIFHKDKK